MQITQGTVLNGIRSVKYPESDCYAIIITARCDFAQEKTDKIFYLIAIPLTQWFFSKKGFEQTISGVLKNITNTIENEIKDYSLSLEDILSFTPEDIEIVLKDNIPDAKKIKKIQNKIEEYRNIIASSTESEQKKKILSDHPKEIADYLQKVANGANSRYVLIPQKFLWNELDDYGLIVDLQELDYFPYDWKEPLEKGRVDIKDIVLPQEQKEIFNSKFHILDGMGYTYPYHVIESPWIEYIMQHFTNLFARIGVDSLEKNDITNIVSIISKTEEE